MDFQFAQIDDSFDFTVGEDTYCVCHSAYGISLHRGRLDDQGDTVFTAYDPAFEDPARETLPGVWFVFDYQHWDMPRYGYREELVSGTEEPPMFTAANLLEALIRITQGVRVLAPEPVSAGDSAEPPF